MKIIEVLGKNVEKAIAEGLKELGKAQDEVDIKIIDEGGLFRKARVSLSFDDGKDEAILITEDTKLQKQDKKEQKEKVKQIKKEEKNKQDKTEDKQEKIVSDNKQKVVETSGDIEKTGKTFLQGLLKNLNIEAEINTVKMPEGISFNINGEKINELIGYRGEALNAIQYLASIVVKNTHPNSVKVFVDVENYKKRREESLISLGKRLAHKCVKINKPVRLEPMTAYERRIIHAALSEDTQVYTKSEGEEPRRYLVIIPKK